MTKFKKILKISLILLCCCFLTVAFYGCDLKGKSAYELAVENGFEGTLIEWLESLKGADGKDGEDGEDATVVNSLYQEAVKNGFTGTFYEFLEEYVKGDTGETGATGPSGTEVVQYATNKAITSAVSVYCNFTGTKTDAWGTTSEGTYTSAGSGVIYKLDKTNGNAYIITNYHVVYSLNSNTSNKISDDIFVLLYGQEFSEYKIQATYIGGSMTYDIAVLEVENSNILKNSNATQIELTTSNYYAGDTAIAIGNPEGEGIAVTSGIVSVDSEYITMTAVDEVTEVTFRVLRIDCAVNSGNSGGGLFNSNGQLIGIVNAKVIDTSVENIGYAIPYTIAVNVADNLIRNHVENGTYKVQKAVFGIYLQITDTIAQYNENIGKVELVQTIKVQSVTEGSVAESAGLQVDDQIISYTYNSKTNTVTRLFHLVDHSLQVEANSTLTLSVIRDGTPKVIELTISELTEIQ